MDRTGSRSWTGRTPERPGTSSRRRSSRRSSVVPMRLTSRHLVVCVISSMLIMGCRAMKPSDSSPPSSSQLDGLATKLVAADLSAMATGLASDPQVNALWNEYADAGPYTALIEDGKRPNSVRFGAALVLLSKNKDRFGNTSLQVIAQVFATALKDNITVWTWPWGRLWADGDPLGHLGRIFPEIGRPALPALEGLLDNTAPR